MLIFGSLKVHIVNYVNNFGSDSLYSDTATEDDTNIRKQIRIHIFGYRKLKRALGAFICTMDDLHRGRKAESYIGV